MPGPDPGIHLAKTMDCRVKLGNDAESSAATNLFHSGVIYVR
jgi:hypothetical protein